MTAVISELNDHEIRVAQDSTILARNPAGAIISGNTIQVGEHAIAQALLNPREFHNRYWYQLDQAPLRRATRAARHHGDLAFRQLEQLHRDADKPDTVVFAVPGGFNKSQLALLLGIAEACHMRPVALVDAAVASAAAHVGPGRYQHIDMQLHRAVVTELNIDATVERGHVDIIDGVGFDKLNDRLVAFVADQFLAQSRFDPLHQASTEQLLHNEMPAWLNLLNAQREIKVHIEFRGSRFEARIAREEIIGVAETTYHSIHDRLSANASWLASSRLAGLPGFVDYHRGCAVLSEASVFEGAAALAEAVVPTESGLSLITSLPACTSPTIASTPTAVADRSAPSLIATHIVSGARAFPLSVTGIYLNADGSISSTANARTVAQAKLTGNGAVIIAENGATVRVNGLAAGDSVFGAGDEITIEGASPVYLPVCLANPDAA
ncbi:MAG: hypothetical protein ACU85U_03130 [Gammaproteobacteria bacterium]